MPGETYGLDGDQDILCALGVVEQDLIGGDDPRNPNLDVK